MSARALAAWSFERSADHPAPEGIAAAIQFRGDLWREYRLEAINAGFDPAQATEYANALSSDLGLASGVSEMAPVGQGWYYQSRIRVVEQTITSGLIELTKREKSKATGGTAVAGAATLARAFRWWNAGGKG